MTLLREIQEAATQSGTRIADLLRKCVILAVRLGHQDLRAWAEHELNGYRAEDQLPDYRVLKGVASRGHFAGRFGRRWQNAPMPLHGVDASVRESLETVCFSDAIAALEDLASDSSGELQSSWPPECIAALRGEIYRDFQCLDAWKVIPKNYVVGILDTVRTRVLRLALEIEQANPDAGEAGPGSALPVPLDKVTALFQTVIHGGTNTIVGPGAQVVQNIQVNQGDLTSLKRHLLEQGVAEADVKELEEALETDPPAGGTGFGKKASEWLGKMLSKAASGAWGKATDVGAVILTEALKKYLGLP